MIRIVAKVAPLALIASLALAANSCSSRPALPADARLTLEKYWSTLSPAGADLRIVRTWQGKAPTAELAPSAPEVQIWCVEAESPPAPGNATPPDKTIWIVTRPDEDSPWSAAMLLTMSSLWPYQACGLEP